MGGGGRRDVALVALDQRRVRGDDTGSDRLDRVEDRLRPQPDDDAPGRQRQHAQHLAAVQVADLGGMVAVVAAGVVVVPVLRRLTQRPEDELLQHAQDVERAEDQGEAREHRIGGPEDPREAGAE